MLFWGILCGSLCLVIGSVGAAVVIVLLLLFPKSFQDRELVRTAIVFAGVAAIALIFVGRAAPVPGTLGRDRSARRQKHPNLVREEKIMATSTLLQRYPEKGRGTMRGRSGWEG